MPVINYHTVDELTLGQRDASGVQREDTSAGLKNTDPLRWVLHAVTRP